MTHSGISKRTTPVSRCCWVPWSMMTTNGRSSETSKWCHSIWPSRRFHEISLFPLPQGQYNENMMGDYIWGHLQESDFQYTCKSRKHNHFRTIVSDFWLSFVYLPCKCCFLSDLMNDNIKIAMFCHNKYENCLCCGHTIKVCAECTCFSIGFRHMQLKYNTWNPGTKIVLHSELFARWLTNGWTHRTAIRNIELLKN